MTDYCLHVDLFVPKPLAETFERKVVSFMLDGGGFAGLTSSEFDLKLILALKRETDFTYAGNGHLITKDEEGTWEAAAVKDTQFRDSRLEKGQPVFHYVHLWSIPAIHSLDLAKLMAKCADDERYLAVDRCVVLEVQNIIRRLSIADSSGLAGSTATILRRIQRFESKDLGTYLFESGSIVPTLHSQGWRQLGQYHNVTGSLNTVVEFWQTPSAATTFDAITKAIRTLRKTGSKSIVDDIITLPLSDQRSVFTVPSYLAKVNAS